MTPHVTVGVPFQFAVFATRRYPQRSLFCRRRLSPMEIGLAGILNFFARCLTRTDSFSLLFA